MAILEKFRFFRQAPAEPEVIIPAPQSNYGIRPLTLKDIDEVLKLNRRCFKPDENYNRATFEYLLSNPQVLSYRVVTTSEKMVGFIFLTIGEDRIGHIATIGVAPEHRRRGIANKLLLHTENSLRKRGVSTIRLEVRVSNIAAQSLYREFGYCSTQRIPNYYTNGEDGFVMIKPIT